MPTRSANTPEEMWPKVLKALLDLKMSANEAGDDGQMAKAVEIENLAFMKLREPIQQMMQAGQGPGDIAQMIQGSQAGPAPMDPMAAMLSPGFQPPATPGLPGAPQGLPPQMGAPQPGSPGGPGGAPNLDELRRMLP
jgi:hypothetical protein